MVDSQGRKRAAGDEAETSSGWTGGHEKERPKRGGGGLPREGQCLA